jgi:hypothetical protein
MGQRVDEPELWELRVGVVATTAQADELMDRLARLLGPGQAPWSLAQVPGRLLDDEHRAVHGSLLEQEEAERGA